jgi:hypothetical protein
LYFINYGGEDSGQRGKDSHGAAKIAGARGEEARGGRTAKGTAPFGRGSDY